MKNMVAAYQHAESYSGRANVDNRLTYKGTQLSTQSFAVEIKARQPNKLFLGFTTSRGSRQIYSDGTDFVVYDPSPNRYQKVHSAPTFAGLIPILQAEAEVVATYDPLYFLSHTSVPPEIIGLKASSVTYNSVPAYRVSGTVRQATRRSRSSNGAIVVVPAETSNWVWWIDKRTYLLQKVEMTVTGKLVNARTVSAKVRKGKVIAVDVFLRHTVVSAATTPALPNKAFEFVPPEGARERSSNSALLKHK